MVQIFPWKENSETYNQRMSAILRLDLAYYILSEKCP